MLLLILISCSYIYSTSEIPKIPTKYSLVFPQSALIFARLHLWLAIPMFQV